MAKLADFGLTRTQNQATGAAETITMCLGTLQWMAPELFNHEDASRATDVYALGMTFFEILDRTVPFGSKNKNEMHRLHLAKKKPERTRPPAPGEPREFWPLILDCIQSISTDRPTTHQVLTRISSMTCTLPTSPIESSGGSILSVEELNSFGSVQVLSTHSQPIIASSDDSFATFSSIQPGALSAPASVKQSDILQSSSGQPSSSQTQDPSVSQNSSSAEFFSSYSSIQ